MQSALEFIPIKPSAAKGSYEPVSYAGHNRFPSRVRGRPPSTALLFTTLHGTSVKDRDLRAMVKRRARKVGIPKDVHPHMLRHTFATDLYRVTKDIRLVQKTLGHADLSTTMIYTHVVDEEVAHAMRTFRQVDIST